MSNQMEIFSDDAFSMMSLTASINEMGHVPSLAGERVFETLDGNKGIPNIAVSVERQQETLTLIPTSTRGGPAPKESAERRDLIHFEIPQIKLEETIGAHQIQGNRSFGRDVQIAGGQSVVQQQLQKMARRHDLTLEHHRLGALKGVILDADGTPLVNLYEDFGYLNSSGLAEPETFVFDFDNVSGLDASVRTVCSEIKRLMKRNAKMTIKPDAKIWAFCGDEFFDKLIEHPSVKNVYDGYGAAEQRLGDSYVHGIFEFGGIYFENYRGTEESNSVIIEQDECRFFWTGVPELYGEWFAPADFMETVNVPGLPRYAKLARDKMDRFVELHTQQNPLPLCLRPATLMRGVVQV